MNSVLRAFSSAAACCLNEGGPARAGQNMTLLDKGRDVAASAPPARTGTILAVANIALAIHYGTIGTELVAEHVAEPIGNPAGVTPAGRRRSAPASRARTPPAPRRAAPASAPSSATPEKPGQAPSAAPPARAPAPRG